MKSKGIINVILLVAVVVMALFLAFGAKKGQEVVVEDAPTALEVIKTRTSIRSYQQKPVEDEKVEELLRAAMSAPTAVNAQPWAFVVVRDTAQLRQLAGKQPYGQMIAEAPLAIVVCVDLTKAMPGEGSTFWIQDVSAATENLLLAANAMDLGAVWTGVYPIQERVNDVSKVLGLPENIIPLNVVPVGYPDGDFQPKDKWDVGKIHYDKW